MKYFLSIVYNILFSLSLLRPDTDGVVCDYQNGLPTLLVPLPSRRERCQFTLKPVTETVGDFLRHLKNEDGGIETVAIYNDGMLRERGTLVYVCTQYV